jgi:ribonucleoside-diphosphate reductase beta chain
MAFAFEVVKTVRHEEPELFDAEMAEAVRVMLEEAVTCETQFAEASWGAAWPASPCPRCDSISNSAPISGSPRSVSRSTTGARNPLAFMDLQDVQEVTNFSSGASPPIRSASPERWSSMPRSDPTRPP